LTGESAAGPKSSLSRPILSEAVDLGDLVRFSKTQEIRGFPGSPGFAGFDFQPSQKRTSFANRSGRESAVWPSWVLWRRICVHPVHPCASGEHPWRLADFHLKVKGLIQRNFLRMISAHFSDWIVPDHSVTNHKS
jgi:hypothetical protein